MPYTAIELMASTSSTATGMSVSCSGVWWWKIDTTGPTGMIAKLMKAGIVAIAGASTNSSLSTPRGMMSSFSGSFRPSISDCSRPNLPARFGPGRDCIRPMTRRSAQIISSVVTIRKAKITTTFSSTSHQGSCPKPDSAGSAAASAGRAAAVAIIARSSP